VFVLYWNKNVKRYVRHLQVHSTNKHKQIDDRATKVFSEECNQSIIGHKNALTALDLIQQCFAEVCSSPYVTNGHAINAKAAYFKTGDEVSFSCNEGFSSPHSTTTCQATKVWSPPTVCTEITCKVPHLGNGRYTVSPDNRETNEMESYDTWISPVCNEGYKRLSLTQRKCCSDGQWSKPDVYCNPITCERLPNTFAHGYYDSGDTQPPFPYNHETSAVCHSGYHLTLPATRRCIEHNTWSEQYPECRRITCKNPYMFSNGQYDLWQTSYDFGTVLVPTCHTGYYMPHTVEKRVCEQLNTWSGNDPQCMIVTCKTPYISNGHYYPLSSYGYNTTITITCNEGYEIKGGLVTRTCQAGGTWDQPSMECVKFVCNDTSDITHEAITNTVYRQLAFNECVHLSYNSTFYFLQNGSLEVKCSENRKITWISKPNFGMSFKRF